MIAFNHNIHFIDEPSLQVTGSNPDLGTYIVSRAEDTVAQWPVVTDWLDMSGQKTRYTAERDFAGCMEGCRWGLEVKDVVALAWVNGEGRIEYRPLINFSPERLRFWVLHTLLPIIFTLQRDFEFLHVGAVEICGKPVLFSAESFGGKSTLTDYFIGQGHKLLADDSLGIYQQGGSFYAVPSYPFHRPYRLPEVLGDPVSNMATVPKPVHSVYLLEKVGADAEVQIKEIDGIEKFKAFHFSSFINFHFFEQRRFSFFSEMAKVTPAFVVTVPWAIDRLEEVYGVLVKHSENIF